MGLLALLPSHNLLTGGRPRPGPLPKPIAGWASGRLIRLRVSSPRVGGYAGVFGLRGFPGTPACACTQWAEGGESGLGGNDSGWEEMPLPHTTPQAQGHIPRSLPIKFPVNGLVTL